MSTATSPSRSSDRGMLGLLPRTPTLEDESQMAFYETVRNFAIGEMFPRLSEQLATSAEQQKLPERGAKLPLRQLRALAEPLPLAGTWKRVMRSQQQLAWEKIRSSLLADAARYEAELDAAERAHPERIHVEPSFVTPDYAKFPIHLQPGGYVGDTLAGYVFHHGTKVFYQGYNDQDELHILNAQYVRPPADGSVQRILDVGCSIGQGTTALKQRFPDAEVWGLDVARPLIRYAHKRAVELDVNVHFKQALAEDTGFPDGHFDVVLAYILFHEVPARLFDKIVGEIRRILRPGGTFTVIDAPGANDGTLAAGNRFWLDFDSQYNCEPYSPAFVATNVPELLGRNGFEVLHAGPMPSFLWHTQAEKPVTK